MRKSWERLAALVLAVCLLLSACGSKTAATTMHLRQTQGTVDVFDGEDKYVSPREGLGLFSGYEVDTQSASYAWVDLDEVKLVKLDEDSEIEILKEDKHLTIEVKSGAMFFNVTEPLADDETMDIRSSSMMVGIRGTCGWVEVSEDGATMTLYLLEGMVECSVGDYSVTVSAGGKAVMHIDGTIEVTYLIARDIPTFVRDEMDEDLLNEIDTALQSPEEETDEEGGEESGDEADPAADALAAYRTIVGQADSYFGEGNYRGEYITFEYSPTVEAHPYFNISDYGAEVTFRYRYALVQMEMDNPLPALVLERETVGDTVGDIFFGYVFQYDPDRQTAERVNGSLREGTTVVNTYRGTLSMAGDSVGLIDTSTFSGGGTAADRILLVEDTLRAVEYRSDETLPIDWYAASDLSGLDSWTPPVQQPEQPTGADADVLPTDGDRIVFTGTVGVYSDEELIALQGLGGQESYYRDGRSYYIILLDTPQEMQVTSGSGDELRSGTVTLISGPEFLAQYAGERHIFSIDPNETYWPSDVSLPEGQPRTTNVRVLG